MHPCYTSVRDRRAGLGCKPRCPVMIKLLVLQIPPAVQSGLLVVITVRWQVDTNRCWAHTSGVWTSDSRDVRLK
jgi:hypothetical protein